MVLELDPSRTSERLGPTPSGWRPRTMSASGEGRLVRMTALTRAIDVARGPAGIYLAASVLGRIGSIVLIPLYTRRLSAEDYGTYGLALTLLNLLPPCLSCGLTSGLTKEFFDASIDTARARVGSAAKGMIVVATAFAALLAVVIALALRDGIGPLRQRHLFLIDFAAVGTAASFIPDAYLRAAQRPRSVVALQLGTLASTSAFGVLFVSLLGRGVDGAIEAAVCTATLTGAVGVLFTFLHLGGNDIVATTRRLIQFSIAFVPHFIASWAQDVGDRWLLSTFGAGRALGPYYVAGQLLSPVPMVVSSWNSADTPRVGELYRAGGRAAVQGDLRRQYKGYAVAGVLPALGIVLLSPIVAPFIGPNLRGAIPLLPFLAAAYVVDALYYPGANAVFYSGRPRAIPLITVVSAGTGLAFGYVFLQWYGLAGIVAARILTSSLRAGLMGIAARLLRANPIASASPG
jgi:O-antigen/teichoic acid export membrane protein